MSTFFGRQCAVVLAGAVSFTAVVGYSSTTRAQGVNATVTPPQSNGQAAVQTDPWSSLSLTPDQKLRIKAIREQTKSEQQAANQRVQVAQKSLDDAIYSDVPDEAAVNERARELSNARAEALKVRALTELSIRRLLTPEQLNTFRELRRKAEEERIAAAKAKADALRAARRQQNAENRLKNKQKAQPRRDAVPTAPAAVAPRRAGARQ